MYKFFLILFLSISLQFNSQVNTQLLSNSSWTQVKSRMSDGSRDLFQRRSGFLLWGIKGNNLCEYVDPLFSERKSCVNFTFQGNSIQIANKTIYEIEKLTSDSLLVVEKRDGVTLPDKVRKMWFVKTSIILKDFTDRIAGDSIVITSFNVSPSLKRDIISEILSGYLDKKYLLDFKVDGEIRIFPNIRKIEVTTDHNKQGKNNQAGIEIFKTTMEKDYKLWDITGFEKFKKIIIPYHFRVKTENDSYGNISFFVRTSTEKDERAIVVIKDKRVSVENFNKGIEATNKQKYDDAIYFFNKAHEEDNTNIESLYNVASISIAQNKTDVACTALKKLKDLEQTEGIKLYNEKCSGK